MTTKTCSGLTIMEVMMAVSIGSFIAAIGFTGINAYGKSIVRAKQFTSETEVITALMREAVDRGNQKLSGMSASTVLLTPKGWTTCAVSGNIVTFTLDLSSTTIGGNEVNAQAGGKVYNALNMDTTSPGVHKNTLQIKTIACFSP